jgi:hypothetical protein
LRGRAFDLLAREIMSLSGKKLNLRDKVTRCFFTSVCGAAHFVGMFLHAAQRGSVAAWS